MENNYLCSDIKKLKDFQKYTFDKAKKEVVNCGKFELLKERFRLGKNYLL